MPKKYSQSTLGQPFAFLHVTRQCTCCSVSYAESRHPATWNLLQPPLGQYHHLRWHSPTLAITDGLCSTSVFFSGLLTRWLNVHQSAPAISAIHLISHHGCYTNAICGNGTRGGGCGWRRWLIWQRCTTQSVLHSTGKDTKQNQNKWPAVKAALLLWVCF